MDDSDIPWTAVESDADLATLLELLRRHRWLRALHAVSAHRVGPEGSQRGYDAHGIFQGDNLASPPLEVRFGAVISLELAGADPASAEAAEGGRDAVGWRLRLRGASVRCAELAYRPFSGRANPRAPSVH